MRKFDLSLMMVLMSAAVGCDGTDYFVVRLDRI